MITFNTTRRLTPIDMYTQHTLKHTQTEAFACFVWKSFSNAPRKRKWKLACCGLKKCISCAHSTSYNTLLILISSKVNRNARGTLFDWIMFGALFFFCSSSPFCRFVLLLFSQPAPNVEWLAKKMRKETDFGASRLKFFSILHGSSLDLPVRLCLNIILLGLVNGNLSLKLAQELRSFTSIDYHQRLRFVNLFAIFFVFMLQICEFV